MADDADGEPDDDTGYCPACGAEVYLYAERCPACGDYITPTLRRKGRGVLWAAIAVLTIVAFLYLLLFR